MYTAIGRDHYMYIDIGRNHYMYIATGRDYYMYTAKGRDHYMYIAIGRDHYMYTAIGRDHYMYITTHIYLTMFVNLCTDLAVSYISFTFTSLPKYKSVKYRISRCMDQI